MNKSWLIAGMLVIGVCVPRPGTPDTEDTQQKPPRITFSCSPRLGVAGPSRPLVVTSRIRVAHPNEELWCPGVRWKINDEEQGSRESDCDTYQHAVDDAGEGEVRSWSAYRRWYLGPGHFEIRVELFKSDETIFSDDCQVSVR